MGSEAVMRRFGGRQRSIAALVIFSFSAHSGCTSRTRAESPRTESSPPIHLEGKRVLLLPVQSVGGTSLPVDPELLFALREANDRVEWISPEHLQRVVARSPGLAGDPRALPADPLFHHGERYAVEPLAGVLRRFAALTDTRLVLIPRSIRVHADRVDLDAVLLDARSGNVLWWGEMVEPLSAPTVDQETLSRFLSGFSRRLVAKPRGGTNP